MLPHDFLDANLSCYQNPFSSVKFYFEKTLDSIDFKITDEVMIRHFKNITGN